MFSAPPKNETKIPSEKLIPGKRTKPIIIDIIPTKNAFLYSFLPKIESIEKIYQIFNSPYYEGEHHYFTLTLSDTLNHSETGVLQ